MNNDERHIRHALRLALKGRGVVTPNPRVGAVIVNRDNAIIGTGWHRYFGAPHAEIEALNDARRKGVDLAGATLYTNLEPCCHQGKTPPCTEAIIQSGIIRVVSSVSDPNPQVNGCGYRVLQKAGIDVLDGVLKPEAFYVNRGYFSYRLRGRAWCTIKVALSLDGRMANLNGTSKWISGIEARRLAHKLRSDNDAVLVGGGTIKHDNPELTVRMLKGRSPIRVVLSPHNGLPLDSNIALTADKIRTILVTDKSNPLPPSRIPGTVENLPVSMVRGKIDPGLLLEELCNRGIQSLLVEGGAKVLSGFIESGIVDELQVAYAPSIIGQGISPFEHYLPSNWESRPRFRIASIKRYGEDVIVVYHQSEGIFLPG